MRIVGECGVNFRNMDEAKLMIDECHRIGVDYSKFQCYSSEQILGNPNYEFLKSIMLNEKKCRDLFKYGQDIGQDVFFTPMYEQAVDFLIDIGLDMFKIRYNDRHDMKLYMKIKNNARIFFRSINHLATKWGNEKLLYCVPTYPALEENYLYMKRCFKYAFEDGISDHTSNTKLLEYFLNQNITHKEFYFEKHVCLTKDCLESEWSCTFDQLEEVLK